MISTTPCPALTASQVKKLEKFGFTRWQKHGKDRLYINPEQIGVEFYYYNSGNISSCWVGDERVSNSEGRRIKGAKTYIDLATHRICIDGACRDTYRDYANERIEEMLAGVIQDDCDNALQSGD